MDILTANMTQREIFVVQVSAVEKVWMGIRRNFLFNFYFHIIIGATT